MNQTAPLPMDERTVRAGQIIFAEGDDSDAAYLILSGKVRILRDTASGPVELRVLDEGKLFGELGLLNGEARSATAMAVDEVKLRVFRRETFFEFMRRNPANAIPIMNQLAAQLRTVTESFQGFLDRTAPGKAEDAAAAAPAIEGSWGARLRAQLRRRLDQLHEFKPDALEIEERPVPMAATATLYTLLGLILAGLLWASLSHVDTSVAARGRLATAAANVEVKPLETSTVRQVAARVGQVVRKGDVLMTLDPTNAAADLSSVKAELASYAAEVARLDAELSGTVPAQFSPDPVLERMQRGLFESRRAEYAAKIANMEKQVEGARARLAAAQKDIGSFNEQRVIFSELVRGRRELYEKQYGSRMMLLQAENQLLSIERELANATSRAEQERSQLAAQQAALQTTASNWASEISSQLVSARRKRDQLQEELTKSERRESLVTLTAPMDSVILQMAPVAEGSVVREGDSLVTLVPSGTALEIEADVEAKDVGHIKVGDPVTIQFEALPFQKYGTVAGRVRVVSRDAFARDLWDQPRPVYRIRVSLERNELRNLPEGFALIPGMIGTAAIRTGERRVISYFLYPVISAGQSALREP
ncbi:MAG: HlyD family type I secretion periplasmic adaptor subunit [Caenispirillum sp.]|nr:HlyD family type I secretion periplasmic adaptor subunit [Caenispirillum sp.]